MKVLPSIGELVRAPLLRRGFVGVVGPSAYKFELVTIGEVGDFDSGPAVSPKTLAGL
jgi:hypothetical protein